MCGIAGFIDAQRGLPAERLRALSEEMAARVRHRGPDGSGAWVDPVSGVALGHRRLSIVDLSEAGSQPMVSSCGRWVICYNGEVYNAGDLRRELEAIGVCFRGHSDTEVLLEACASWGLEKTLRRLIGMFAFALWDRDERLLVLVRDRLGIKPLYWARFGKLFLFGSELKALYAHPGWTREVDRNALSAYLRHNYIPCPYTIWRGVWKLPAGSSLWIRPGKEPNVRPYWELEQVARVGQMARLGATDEEAVEELDRMLRDAIRRRMIADVPLGAFLSGGVDSSTVVALMQAQSNRPVKTFSIGFREAGYNEAGHAKKVAEHLGCEHTELYVEPKQALEVIPCLPDIYDEPFADSSQIPTYLVSALTRRHVTVSLSGDGGDELFAGYNRYFQAGLLADRFLRLPYALRSAASKSIRSLPPAVWEVLFRMVPGRWRPPQPADKMRKLADVLTETRDAIYRRLVSHWEEPDRLVRDGTEPQGLLWTSDVPRVVPDFIDRMQYLDTLTYLPDDILTKVDRASMAVSLEARVPMLDHRVVEFSWRLPRRLRIRNGQGKWLLRRVLYRYVPKSLIERPKMGFGVPIDSWLRGPLRGWAEGLLTEEALKHFFDPGPIRIRWEEHLSGRRNWQYSLWTILMFQAWRERWIEESQPPADAGVVEVRSRASR